MGDVKVLYIAGVGRSGSTLLGNILGQQDGFFNAGELHWIWQRGFMDNELCGCDTPFRECSVWQEILRSDFANLEHQDLHALINEWKISTQSRRMLEYSFLPNRKTTPTRKNYLNALHLLYHAIQVTTHCRVIVDTSKAPTYGHLVSLLPGIQLFVLHLIRDSRGVVFSLQRSTIRPEDKKPMIKMKAWKSSALWLLWNTGIELRWNRRDRYDGYLRMRYEDFILNPQRNIERIFHLIGENLTPRNIRNNRVEIDPTHTVSGNPGRFKHGVIDLRLSLDWQDNMVPRDRLLTQLITWPLLLRYGYL